jgi:hypothetical protein
MQFNHRFDDESEITHLGGYEPGMSLSTTIEAGDEVTLKGNGSLANVIVNSIDGDSYEGTVKRIIDGSDGYADPQHGD